MRKQKKDKDMIHFSGRRHSKLGIISTILGVIVVAGFITLSMISGLNKGNGGILLGILGILIFGMSILGFVFAYKAYLQKDIFYRFPVLGLILNGLMSIVMLIIYILGFGG